MIGITLLIYIVAMALPSIRKNISSIFFIRISTIVLFYAGILSLNSLYIQSIGSGIGIYSGFYQITYISMHLDTFILMISSILLVARPINLNFDQNKTELLVQSLTNTKVKVESIRNNLLTLLNIPSLSISGKYCLVILFSTLGSLLLVSSADLISMYLSIELQSFGVYILASLFRESKLASSAGLKYFLLGGLSSCLILLGAALIYSYTGLTNLDSIYTLISVYNIEISKPLLFGFILIVVGLLFKIAAAPLHNWAPDVYDDSPTVVTIWLTIMPKIAILTFLLEVLIGGIGYNIYSNLLLSTGTTSLLTHDSSSFIELLSRNELIDIGTVLRTIILISSLLSLIIGTVLGLAQTKIKRLLAYSTISHLGFILLALSVNTEQSIESFIFYIFQYSLTNLNTFLIILAFGYIINYSSFQNSGKAIQTYIYTVANKANEKENNYYIEANKIEESEKDIKFISELKGQFNSNPLLVFAISICLFSMAGIPPLMGFFSKQLVLSSAIENGYYFISIVAILVSVISASYYLKIVRVLFTPNIINSTIKEDKVNALNNNISAYVTLLNNKILYNSIDNNINKEIEGKERLYYTLPVQHILSNFHSFLISSLTLSILLFIFKPSILLNSCQLLSLSLYHI